MGIEPRHPRKPCPWRIDTRINSMDCICNSRTVSLQKPICVINPFFLMLASGAVAHGAEMNCAPVNCQNTNCCACRLLADLFTNSGGKRRQNAENRDRNCVSCLFSTPEPSWQSGGHGFDPRQLHQKLLGSIPDT
jgi:hypothetical protein